MNKEEAHEKYPSLTNFGFNEQIYRPANTPGDDWIPAKVVEAFISRSLPVFSARQDGIYRTWVNHDFAGSEVMGFILGPFQIPDYEGRPKPPETSKSGLVDPRGNLIELPQEAKAQEPEGGAL